MTTNDPELYFADDGAPRSGRFGDIYYSLQDGLNESRAVFLRGCHLPEGWAGCHTFCVLELGFGTGLNIGALMKLWAENRPAGGHLHIFSIEGYLMDVADARTALSNWPELQPFSTALLAQWPKARRGFASMDFPEWGISFTLGLMDVRTALGAWDGQADAVFLDGFSPALNPDMWAEDVIAAIARKTRPGARLATFTVAGFVRRGLQAAGFSIEKHPGYGRKRERLEAIFLSDSSTSPISPPIAPPRKIAIIGAGIAGCSLFYQARLLGLDADIFDTKGIGSGASGNVAGLVTPRLDAGDTPTSALFADAFTYATDLYRRLCPEAISGQGVYQCEATPKDASRFARIKDQTCFAADDLSLFEAGETADMPQAAGIRLNTALWIEPVRVLMALLNGYDPILARITDVRDGSLITADGQIYEGYDAVILANGEGVFDMPEQAPYDLRPVRGQVEVVSGDKPLQTALSWGGYAIPLENGYIFGATHERDDRGCEVREADRARNLDSLAKAMPERAAVIKDVPFISRARIRVMTRDFVPMCGMGQGGIYLLNGLGARGYCLGPLLAKSLLAQMTGAPSPLPLIAKTLLHPDRLLFAAKAYI